jgi:predicted CXXCH cytochrome family protein
VHNNGPKKGEEGTITNSFLNKKLSENGNFCAGCHEDKKDFAASKHNIAKFEKLTPETEALKASNDTCGVCHKVHNSGFYLFDKALGDSFEKVCSSCHKDSGLAEKTKIETSHKMNVKPKTDIKIFLQDGNIVCATCHEPHSTDKGMLRETGETNICFACHADQKPVALSEHNLARLDYMSEKVRKQAESNVCFVCHAPHNFHDGNRLMWAFEPDGKTPFSFEVCTDCHKKDGEGYKKIPEVLTHDRIFKIFPYRERFKEYLFDDAGLVSAEGSITCKTCHNPHVWKKGMTAPEANVEGDVNNSFLKKEVSGDFCSVCHGTEQGSELFSKYHSKEYRESRNKKQGEAEVLKNLFMIQQNLQKLQEK